MEHETKLIDVSQEHSIDKVLFDDSRPAQPGRPSAGKRDEYWLWPRPPLSSV